MTGTSPNLMKNINLYIQEKEMLTRINSKRTKSSDVIVKLISVKKFLKVVQEDKNDKGTLIRILFTSPQKKNMEAKRQWDNKINMLEKDSTKNSKFNKTPLKNKEEIRHFHIKHSLQIK